MLYKFRIVVLLLFLKNQSNDAVQQLCASSKMDKMCVCKRTIDQDHRNPVMVADCSRIDLQTFPYQDQLRTELVSLDLSHNRITTLLQNDSSFSSDSLEILSLSHNNINHVDGEFFNEIPNLKRLMLDHNNLTVLGEIFHNLQHLVYLDLSFNNIKTVSDNILSSLNHLEIFNISYNSDLGEFLSKSLDRTLGLSENLTHLEMNNVGLNNLPLTYFHNYTNLKYLSLADNNFTIIPNIPYSVKYLDVSGSGLSSLQAKYFNYHSLRILKLNRLKKLETIHKYAFYNLQSLEELSISECNNLPAFNELAFGLLSKNTTLTLKRLSLARNSLEHFNETFKYLLDQLELVDLTDNRWNCDCNLLWLQDFDHKNQIRCSIPRRLRNKRLTDIKDSDLPDCFPEKYGKKLHRILIPILILLVIILSALIGYLIYYAPNLYGSRGVGPQSPYYNPTRLQVQD